MKILQLLNIQMNPAKTWSYRRRGGLEYHDLSAYVKPHNTIKISGIRRNHLMLLSAHCYNNVRTVRRRSNKIHHLKLSSDIFLSLSPAKNKNIQKPSQTSTLVRCPNIYSSPGRNIITPTKLPKYSPSQK